MLSKRISFLKTALQGKFAIYILVGTLITFTLFLINIFVLTAILRGQDHMDVTVAYAIYAVTLIFYFIYIIFSVVAFTDKLKKEAEIAHQKELFENLQAYSKSVENMAAEVRKFRHDHENLLMGFHEYIKNNDMENIRVYFEKYLTTFRESADVMGLRLDVLSRLQISEVKGILLLKCLYAKQQGIDVYVEIPEEIECKRTFNITDLCRVFGILLDNAIEAALNAKEPILRFLAMKEEAGILFVFMNTYLSPPNMAEIYQMDTSTKGEGRGIGLYTVSLLVNNNANLSLDTRIDDGCFIQELSMSVEK